MAGRGRREGLRCAHRCPSVDTLCCQDCYILARQDIRDGSDELDAVLWLRVRPVVVMFGQLAHSPVLSEQQGKGLHDLLLPKVLPPSIPAFKGLLGRARKRLR